MEVISIIFSHTTLADNVTWPFVSSWGYNGISLLALTGETGNTGEQKLCPPWLFFQLLPNSGFNCNKRMHTLYTAHISTCPVGIYQEGCSIKWHSLMTKRWPKCTDSRNGKSQKCSSWQPNADYLIMPVLQEHESIQLLELWLRISHTVVDRYCQGYSHLRTWLGLEDLFQGDLLMWLASQNTVSGPVFLLLRNIIIVDLLWLEHLVPTLRHNLIISFEVIINGAQWHTIKLCWTEVGPLESEWIGPGP